MGIPAQGAITRDNVTLTVDGVVYYRVIDPVKAIINVQHYPTAVSQVAQTSLRAVIGRAALDTLLSETMKRCMSRQAAAERERRARVIAADGEYQASAKLAQAAEAMGDTPGALQLRLLQTVVDVAAEKNSTLVMPFPVEMLRFFDRANTTDSRAVVAEAPAEPPAEVTNGHPVALTR